MATRSAVFRCAQRWDCCDGRLPDSVHSASNRETDGSPNHADLLPRHTAILAGSGSGKTVLLRRLVEEAALLGIPSVVLDINNDLSRLGDWWPARPDAFSDADVEAAAAYHARANLVIWTPGVSSGNPVSLNLLPDFAAIGIKPDNQTEDERAQAVEMARATLSPYLTGAGQKASLKQGVLADALRAFAKRGGGSLNDLIGLLSELPEDASKIGDAPKLASDIANQLLAAIATNPLLQSAGTSLDPQRLFHGKDGRTRISVINLAGLAAITRARACCERACPAVRQTMPCQVRGKTPVRIFIGAIGAPARVVDRVAGQGAILSGGSATRGVFGRFAKACISGAIVL